MPLKFLPTMLGEIHGVKWKDIEDASVEISIAGEDIFSVLIYKIGEYKQKELGRFRLVLAKKYIKGMQELVENRDKYINVGYKWEPDPVEKYKKIGKEHLVPKTTFKRLVEPRKTFSRKPMVDEPWIPTSVYRTPDLQLEILKIGSMTYANLFLLDGMLLFKFDEPITKISDLLTKIENSSIKFYPTRAEMEKNYPLKEQKMETRDKLIKIKKEVSK